MAVYTDVTDQTLKEFVQQYAIGEITSFKGIAEGVENSNYLLKTTKGDYILTLYEKRVEKKDLPFFLGLMEYLSERSFPAPVPVVAKDGTTLRELCGKPAAICTFLEGMWPKTITPRHCAKVGEAAARLHLASHGYDISRPNALGLAGWQQLYSTIVNGTKVVDEDIIKTITQELDFLKQSWPRDLPRGIIHADLFPDNVFFTEHQITGVIDFYFSCNDFLAYDIAICLNAWCFDDESKYRKDCGEALLVGYNSVRKMEDKEEISLPILCRGASLRFLLTRLHDLLHPMPGALVNPKNPLDYMRRLSFHQQISTAKEYLQTII